MNNIQEDDWSKESWSRHSGMQEGESRPTFNEFDKTVDKQENPPAPYIYGRLVGSTGIKK